MLWQKAFIETINLSKLDFKYETYVMAKGVYRNYKSIQTGF